MDINEKKFLGIAIAITVAPFILLYFATMCFGFNIGLALVAVILVIGILLFTTKAHLMPGWSKGVRSPDGKFMAHFGTRSEKISSAKKRTLYLTTVEIVGISGYSFELFSKSIDQSTALNDLTRRSVKSIVKWSSDSSKVTFFVSHQPIVVNVKELALAKAPDICRTVGSPEVGQ